jgi:hypothetical protein
MSITKAKIVVLLVLILMMSTSLSCGLSTEKTPPTITINFPAEKASVEVGEEVEIVSTASGEAGITRVELSVNDRVVHIASPDSGNPTTFAAIQPWTPEDVGDISISVIAYDINGESSQPASITLTVVGAQIDVTPSPTVTSTPPPTSELPTAEPCTLDASFVTDVTIPDNTELVPGKNFTKIWRVTNSGTCDWQPGIQLIFDSGDMLGGPSTVAISAANAGSTVDISVDLTAPAAYGDYTGIWRIRAGDGTVFGPHLTVTIIVPEPATITPTHTLTPTATPTSTPTPVPEAEIQQVYNQISIAAGEIGHAVVSCPVGTILTSGGFAVHPNILVYNQSQSGNGWQVYGKNNGASEKLLNVYATCISNTGSSSTQILNQVTAVAGGIGHAVASCPAGSVVTGGGWASSSDGNLIVYNSSRSGNGWQIYARNTSGSGKLLNAYAICLQGTAGTTDQILNQVTIPSGDTGAAEATCSSGSLVTGGGFAGNADLITYNTSMVSGSDTKWRSYAQNPTASSALFNGYAICISLP